MADFDLILRRENDTDIGVADGLFVAIEPEISGSCRFEIVLGDRKLFPGFIDAHVHFNEPGRAEWEGFETGSRALAAGGGTVFCDMPLNSSPPVVDAAAFEQKRKIGEEKSCIDFALWGGLIPGNQREIPAMAELGAIGLKAFMADSGLDEFPWVTPDDLREGMKAAAAVNLPVAVHAESQAYLASLPQPDETGVKGFLQSRPIAAEVEAIRIACELSGETGCALHIVHVSSAEGVNEVEKAKGIGVDVTIETCPHYLFFCDKDMIDLGAVAKCAPPLRSPHEVGALISKLVAGSIDTIGSDHSPALPEMKGGEFAEAWGGISGCQHAFPAFLSKFPDFVDLLTINPAARMGLAHRKGSIETGKDADFTIVDFSKTEAIAKESLLYRHPISAWIGREMQCRIEMTFCRGRQVYGSGRIPSTQQQNLCSPYLARQELT
ncbi:MAG: allantoinase AllB [Verrucomicrobiales bacterium]|nr:allantoinase AllB [Verrucomicrobiales bacterium]